MKRGLLNHYRKLTFKGQHLASWFLFIFLFLGLTSCGPKVKDLKKTSLSFNFSTVDQLLKGGIYIYPCTINAPKGRLRLLYECNPLAFISEQAGGMSSTGTSRIMEIKPEKLHERVAFFTGSKSMVEKAMGFLK